MFGLLRKKNPYQSDAYAVYERMMQHSRSPVFYQDMGVPDSFDGRYDLLVVHAYLLFEVLNEKDSDNAAAFNQALFDQIFKHMKVTLREIGVGDVGIPKHMQKMMKAFNGRMHSYSEALQSGDLDGVLIRNVYGTIDEPDLQDVEKMADYIRSSLERLRKKEFDEIITGEELFEF